MSTTDAPFLQGRAFIAASAYADLLPPHLVGEYLAAAVKVLQTSDATVPLKVAALKSVRKYVPGHHQLPFNPDLSSVVSAR